jgi:predicted RNase H-like HicB family nuclease
MDMRYAVVITDEDNQFAATVPDLPGVFATGVTRAEVVENVREAIRLYLESVKAEGRPVERPRAEATVVEVA